MAAGLLLLSRIPRADSASFGSRLARPTFRKILSESALLDRDTIPSDQTTTCRTPVLHQSIRRLSIRVSSHAMLRPR
jgi:hypothetical protein